MSETRRWGRLGGRFLILLPLLAALLLVAGCARFGPGSPPASNSLQVAGTSSEGTQFELTVVDPDSLVTGGQTLSRPGGTSDRGVQLDADGQGVLVWWPGLLCEEHPLITLSSEADTLKIKLENGPRNEGVCQMNEVQFTVQLRLASDNSSAELTD